LWLLIALCIVMLLTIEVAEDYVEQDWPRFRRPGNGWSHAGVGRLLWTGVGLLVFPGLVLAILNLALLIARDLPQTPVQMLGGVLVMLGWGVFALAASGFGSVSAYIEDLGPVAPLAVAGMLLVGDLLLLIELVGLLPGDLRQLLP
jgi:hypothetical protein